MEGNLSFKQTNEYFTVEVSVPGHSNIGAVIDAFKSFLIAVQFNPNLVKEYFPEN
jgi:hypothetical protein